MELLRKKEGWDSVFSKVESVESGFMSRLNIIATEESRTVATLRVPDFEPLRRRFFPLIQDLENNPRDIEPSPGAVALVERWFSNLVLPEGVSRARLNIHAWRCALHLAWLHGHQFITEQDADAGIQLANYQTQMREWYAPPEGETRGARCQAAIRKVMRGVVKISMRELMQKTHYKRVGVGDWQKALKLLVDAGEVRIAEEPGLRGQTRKTVILLKTKQ